MNKIWLLIFLTACTALPQSPGHAGLMITQEKMPKWAAQPANFQLSADETTIGSKLEITTGPADYSWGIAYVLTDYKIWEKIIINPILTKDSIVQQWVKGTARFTLDVTSNKFTPGKTYYVITYWCNKGDTWQCNGNKWMLLSFKITEQRTIITPAPEIRTEIINVQIEIDQIEKELNDLENEERLLNELT
jgi:hypothetical protein